MTSGDADKLIGGIILKSASASLSVEEQACLDAWLAVSEANRSRYRELTDPVQLKEKIASYHQRNENKELNFKRVMQELQRPARIVIWKQRSVGLAVAAIVCLLLSGMVFWQYSGAGTKNKLVKNAPVADLKDDALPGKDGAMLMLEDGSVIVLDSLGNGVVPRQHGSKAVLQNGLLSYDAGIQAADVLQYHTLSTPGGRQFGLLLPDGTRVWLNAASSIRYPVSFLGGEREVSVSGEAYFEVVTDKEHPFIVKTGTNAVQVLGTGFNINAYDNEPGMQITLLEGAVKVGVCEMQNAFSFKQSALLKPGQQAQITDKGNGETVITTGKADIDKVMAWHRGLFNFEDIDLKQAMRQLARWYNLEVVYEGEVPDIRFTGELSRSMKLSTVLRALEDSKVHFTILDKKIIIRP